MPGGSFTVYVRGGEAQAENLAWACGKIFGRPPTFFTRSRFDQPMWSFIVKTRPEGGGDDEARAWADMTKALMEAASGMELAPPFPATRELRARLDRFIRYVASFRAAYPDAEVMIGLPGERPAPLGGFRSRDLAWRLMA